MRIAVVTGASSGIGREFARELDKKGLDEIWPIARREERLMALKDELCTSEGPPCIILRGDGLGMRTMRKRMYRTLPATFGPAEM